MVRSTKSSKRAQEARRTQNAIREIFGSTFLLIENTRAHHLNPPGKSDALELLLDSLPPVLEHCRTVTRCKALKRDGSVVLDSEAQEGSIRIAARDDGTYDLHVELPSARSCEDTLSINMVIMKVLAYDLRPMERMEFGLDEEAFFAEIERLYGKGDKD